MPRVSVALFRQRPALLLLVVSVLIVLAAGLAASFGATSMGWARLWAAFAAGPQVDAGSAVGVDATILWNIRLPRVALALLVGAGLALAGASMQGLFRNPLADPGLIGVSSGGAVGAVMGIFFIRPLGSGWLAVWALPLAALLGAMAATYLIYRLARVGGQTHVITLLLTGIAVNALAGAWIGLMIFTASDDQLRRYTFWTLGSLSGAGWAHVAVMAIGLGLAVLLLRRRARALNAFLLGEADAYHLGVDIQHTKRRLVVVAALLSGLAVACCGMIGFVGLVVPHLIRLLAGPDHRTLLPGAALLGGLLLLIADTVARTVAAPMELPIGVLTACLGAPFFLILLFRGRRAA